MAVSPLRRLLVHARAHRGRVRLAVLCSILNKIFDLAPPLLIGAAVDIVVRREQSFLASFGFPEVQPQLWLLAGITLLIWTLESVFEYVQRILWRNLAQVIEHEVRIDAYSHVQDLDAAWFDERGTGGLMAVLNDDVNQLERFLDVGANELVQVSTTVIVIGSIFFGLAPQVAWMSCLPIPFILWGSVRFQRLLQPRYAKVRQEVSLLSDLLAGNLSGVATIKSFTAEQREVERLRVRSDAYRDANRHAIALSSAFSPLIRMVIVLGFTAMLVAGGLLAVEGQLAVGAYSVLVFLTQRLLWPLTRLGETFDLYQRAMASTTRLLDLLDTPATVRSGGRPLPLTDVRGELRFEDVSFRYPSGGGFGLEGLDLSLPAGETTAIVGSTGAGKSTVIKLLLRFHDPSSGVLRLDGHDLRELELGDLRRAIGLVSQDVFLFHGSVRENVVFGRPDATEEEIVEACRVAEAHGFIEELPEGYDTIVGERGQKLSGGQRQRLSIARALLKDPPVLVLDEATSSVDNETEAAIQRSLAKVAVGRTTLVIAHRLSTVRNAHRIHVLEAGRLVESGTHEDLLGREGLYAALWRVQTGEATTTTR
ncbi:MAG: ABC transporter ATP-binding protein [Acidobacteriota bacterium]